MIMSTAAGTGNRMRPDLPWLLPAALTSDTDIEPGRLRRTTRDWIVDVLCFLIAVGFGLLAAFDLLERRPLLDWLTIVDLLVGTGSCVVLWWRRRWPVTIAVVLAVLGSFASVSAFAGLIALFTVAVHRRFTIVAGVTVISFAASVPYNAYIVPLTDSFWLSNFLSFLILALVVAWGMVIRARRQLVMSLRERARLAETEAQLRADQARHLERERIAREMHDVLAHRISLLSLHAGALEFRPDAPPEDVAHAAGVIRESAHQALQDLRQVIGVLRRHGDDGADPERPQPTLAGLPALVAEARLAGQPAQLDNRLGDLSGVPEGIGRDGYRLVQEGLTNARKHAPGSAVEVTVDGAPGDGLTLEVANPLPAGLRTTPAMPGAGTGILGLTERTELAGGRIEHGRTTDGRFVLTTWLPWPA